jgi:hypothetical protein
MLFCDGITALSEPQAKVIKALEIAFGSRPQVFGQDIPPNYLPRDVLTNPIKISWECCGHELSLDALAGMLSSMIHGVYPGMKRLGPCRFIVRHDTAFQVSWVYVRPTL